MKMLPFRNSYQLVFCVLVLSVPTIVSGMKTYTDIINHIKNSSDPRIRPGADADIPTSVNISLFVRNIHAINEESQSLKMDMSMRKLLHDPRLSYEDGPPYMTLDGKTCQELIWLPSLYFVSSRETWTQETLKPDMGCRFLPSGILYSGFRTGIILDCKMKLHKFPFDTQECALHIEEFFSTTASVRMNWMSPPQSALSDDDVHTIFQFVSISGSKTTLKYAQHKYDRLTVTVKLRRIYGHYLAFTYIPSLLLVALSCLTIWLPSGNTQKMYSCACLLIVMGIVMAASQYGTPQVGYLKAIDVWVLACFIFLLVALLVVQLLHLVDNKTPTSMPGQFELMKEEERSRNSMSEVSTGAPSNPASSLCPGKSFYAAITLKIIYTLAFILFIIVYWSVYMA